MADTVTVEAARVPRVSDETMKRLVGVADWVQGRCDVIYKGEDVAIPASVILDLRDERQASRDKDATIADLERRLVEADAIQRRLATTVRFSDNLGNELRARAQRAESRADALQARLTEAEQRAATAERRGFKACRDAAARLADQGSVATCWRPTILAMEKLAAAIRALAPAVPQEGETTP